MLDGKSLDVISKFKLALLTRAEKPVPHSDLPVSTRGHKLPSNSSNSNRVVLTPKIVEYNGNNHLVLTNDAIERSNYQNKRRWQDFYSTGRAKDDMSSEDEISENEIGNEEFVDGEDENPLKKLRLSEILAPLAHPSEVATHPAILKTYKLTCFATLASDLIHSIEVEQNTLNQFNKLLQVLDGEDWYFQLEENMQLPIYDHGLDDENLNGKGGNGENPSVGGPLSEEKGELAQTSANIATTTTNAPATVKETATGANQSTNGSAAAVTGTGDDGETEESPTYKRITRGVTAEEKVKITDPFFGLPKSIELFERQQQKQLEEDEEKDDDPLEILKQDLRNYLQVSIQRQHECIKNLTTIRNGIVKADKYKRDLFRWGKEMSEKK